MKHNFQLLTDVVSKVSHAEQCIDCIYNFMSYTLKQLIYLIHTTNEYYCNFWFYSRQKEFSMISRTQDFMYTSV